MSPFMHRNHQHSFFSAHKWKAAWSHFCFTSIPIDQFVRIIPSPFPHFWFSLLQVHHLECLLCPVVRNNSGSILIWVIQVDSQIADIILISDWKQSKTEKPTGINWILMRELVQVVMRVQWEDTSTGKSFIIILNYVLMCVILVCTLYS